MSLTVSQIEEMGNTSKYLRGEFNGKLYGSIDGDVNFDKMMDFLSNEDNLQTMQMIVDLAKQVNRG